MKIIIGNQKGGVGKSTVCILLANYLTLKHGREVVVLDLDFQDSVYSKWERDRKLYSNEMLYEAMKIDTADYPKVSGDITALSSEAIVLIDMPGRLDDDSLLEILKDADMFVCPFAYEQSVFESTFFFAKVVKHMNPSSSLVFLPTRLNKSVKYTIKEQVSEALAPFGQIAPEIGERVALQRIDTVSMSSEANEVIGESFDFIYDHYIAPS